MLMPGMQTSGSTADLFAGAHEGVRGADGAADVIGATGGVLRDGGEPARGIGAEGTEKRGGRGMGEATEVTFVVPGTPVGKGRPKVASRGGKFAQLYTPEKTVSYEALVATSGYAAMKGRPLIEGAVFVALDIRLPVPASWSKRKQVMALDGKVYPTKKPDIDNVEKAIFDGLNGVVWRDDVQVVSVEKQKRYSAFPGVEVLVREISREVA